MGIITSSEARAQKQQHVKVEQELRQARLQNEVKLLLLGSAECGKSTILKQMRILHDNGFSQDEIEKNRSVVFINMIESVRTMLAAMKERCVELPLDLQDAAEVIRGARTTDTPQCLSADIVQAIRRLWATKAMRTIYLRRDEYHMPDCAKYFLDNLERIADRAYAPTSQDMLMLRVETNGILQVHFTIDGTLFKFFDVGGQRSNRKKWIHCFDDVSTLIFVAALSDYDMLLKEDSYTNRLLESLKLFEHVVNSPHFVNLSSFILFLNKKDIFAQKLLAKSIRTAFPVYTGGQGYTESVDYIRKNYCSKLQDKSKHLIVHETCATDTNQLDLVLQGVISMLLSKQLKEFGYT